MIVEFTVKNFRSIYKTQTLRFIPKEGILDYPNNIYLCEDNTKLLNVVCIYGANASGKSNILKGIFEMRSFVINSNKLNSTDKLPDFKFKLFKENINPTTFQLKFIINKNLYIYGFSFNEKEIVAEWLHKLVNKEVEKLFERSYEDIEINENTSEFKNQSNRLDVYIESTNPNTLFLSKLDSNGVDVGKQILLFFKRISTFNISSNNPFYDDSNLNQDGGLPSTAMYSDGVFIKDENTNLMFSTQEKLNQFLQEFKLNISKVFVPQADGNNIQRLKVRHNLIDINGKILDDFFDSDFLEMESRGTVRLSRIAIPIMISTLNGTPLIIDELEDKLHPLIVNYIIFYYLNPETNPFKAQLIFTTHNTNILSYSKLRRDQIWLTEKNNLNATELYSLAEILINKNSNEESVFGKNIERNYLEGKFGAIPF